MLIDEVKTFFQTFVGADVEASIIGAFCICFTLMLVYGILIRPFINLCGATKNTKQNRFFDIIMISLILMTGFRMIFPAAFSEKTILLETVSTDSAYSVDLLESSDSVVTNEVISDETN